MKLISILSGKYFGFNTLYSNQSSSLGHWASRDVAHEGDVVVSLTRLAPLPPSPCVPLLLLSSSKLAGADNFLDNSVDSDQVLLYHQENCYPANKIHNLLLHKNWRTHLKISFLSSAISVLSCINGNLHFFFVISHNLQEEDEAEDDAKLDDLKIMLTDQLWIPAQSLLLLLVLPQSHFGNHHL